MEKVIFEELVAVIEELNTTGLVYKITTGTGTRV